MDRYLEGSPSGIELAQFAKSWNRMWSFATG